MSDAFKLPPASGADTLSLSYPERINVDVEMADTEIPYSWDTQFSGFIGTHGGFEVSRRYSTEINERWGLTASGYLRAQVGDEGLGVEPGVRLGATYDRFDFSVPLGYEIGGGGFTTGLELGYDLQGFGGFDPVGRVSFNDDGGAFTIGFRKSF